MQKQKLTLEEYVSKYGTRQTARKLVEKKIGQGIISLDDLPDSNEVCSIIDSVEEALQQEPIDREMIKSCLAEIDDTFMMNLIMS